MAYTYLTELGDSLGSCLRKRFSDACGVGGRVGYDTCSDPVIER